MRRMMLGTSQTNLADAFGLTSKSENMKRPLISASRLQQTAHVLQVPVAFFFEGAPNVPGARVLILTLSEGSTVGACSPDERARSQAIGRSGRRAARLRRDGITAHISYRFKTPIGDKLTKHVDKLACVHIGISEPRASMRLALPLILHSGPIFQPSESKWPCFGSRA
jgi:transcriptional regulator with XRE-family HTH domain